MNTFAYKDVFGEQAHFVFCLWLEFRCRFFSSGAFFYAGQGSIFLYGLLRFLAVFFFVTSNFNAVFLLYTLAAFPT